MIAGILAIILLLFATGCAEQVVYTCRPVAAWQGDYFIVFRCTQGEPPPMGPNLPGSDRRSS